MYYKDKMIIKLLLFFISLLLAGIVVGLYFLEGALDWGADKIIGCVIISTWVFFMIPALRRAYLNNKDKPTEEWIKMGVRVGISGIFLPALFAPVYGIIYYFDGLVYKG